MFGTSRHFFSALFAVFTFAAIGCGATSADVVENDEVLDVGDETVVDESALSGGVAVGVKLRTTTGLNLRTGPSVGHAIILAMPAGATVTVLRAQPSGGFYEVKYGSARGWSSGTYLVRVATPSPGAGSTGGSNVTIVGPAVLAHVQAFANAACAAVGCPLRVGTYVGHDPVASRALDLMQSFGVLPADGGARGNRLAQYTLDHFGAHRVYYVIWKQRINTGDSRGWVAMENRGSITQNHFDHVHVSFKP